VSKRSEWLAATEQGARYVNQGERARREHIKSDWQKGSMPPAGYADWQEWAEAQQLHGLRQRQCATCLLWQFPHEPRACKGLRCKS
jgi:hypothetical protein